MNKRMKRKVLQLVGLSSTALILFSNISPVTILLQDNSVVEAQVVEQNWGTAKVNFDTETGTLTVSSGEISTGWNPTFKSQIKEIIFGENVIAPQNSYQLFAKFYGLQKISGPLDTSKVTNMSYLFSGSSNITSLETTSSWDTSNVTNMGSMFAGLSQLTSLDTSNFNTSKVTVMYSMFEGLSSLTNLNVGSFDTSSVTSMGSMFRNMTNLQELDVSNFNTSNVTGMGYTFSGLQSLTSLDLANFNTSQVVAMFSMFENCPNLTFLNVSNFDTSKVTTMTSMFSGLSQLETLDVSNFNTSNVTDIDDMFLNSGMIDLDVSNFDMSKTMRICSMFAGMPNLKALDVSNWNTKNKDTQSIFDRTGSLASLTLGENSIFSSNAALPNALPNTNSDYTGRWIKVDPELPISNYPSSTDLMSLYDGTRPGTYIREKAKVAGGNVTIQYKDTLGNTIATPATLYGNVGDPYTSEKLTISGYTFKEVQGDTTGEFTEAPQTVTYIYEANETISTKKGTVTVHYVDTNNNVLSPTVVFTGGLGDSYTSEKLTISGYTFKEVQGNTTGKFTETPQTVTYIYTRNTDVANKQSITGTNYTMYLGDPKPTINDFNAYATNKDGQKISIRIDYSKVNFEKAGVYPVTLISSDNQIKIVELTIINKLQMVVPIFRAYNPNDGDHLYTSSLEEYKWITDLKWNAEGIAFNSVREEMLNAAPVYRLYNPNSGEHFYTLSITEYDKVSKAGWDKEGISFYMLPKTEGKAIYRVFNPNTKGPGSHLFTESKYEADQLVKLGWKDEGIAFYGAK